MDVQTLIETAGKYAAEHGNEAGAWHLIAALLADAGCSNLSIITAPAVFNYARNKEATRRFAQH